MEYFWHKFLVLIIDFDGIEGSRGWSVDLKDKDLCWGGGGRQVRGGICGVVDCNN